MTRLAIHPGEILSGELDELGISPTGLARQTNVPANRVSQALPVRPEQKPQPQHLGLL